MSEEMSSPPAKQGANRRRRRSSGYGCALLLALVLVGGLIGAVLWGPTLFERWTTPTSGAPLVLADHPLHAEMVAQREQQIAQLNGYGWVDQAAGVAHIPITEAIAQLAATGLPVGAVAVSQTATVSATAPSPAVDLSNVNYADNILPIVEQHCAECHGDQDPEEGLKLTTYRALMNGSQNGPVVVAGDPDASYLVEMVVSGKMPKRGKHLSQSEIDTIIAWIKAGAPEHGSPAAETATPAPTAAAVDLSKVSFQANVLPIFVQHCSECHGDEKQEEALKLTSYRSVLAGSQNGTVVEPGDPDGSYLVKQIVSGKMPKRGKPLTQQEIDTIIAWIKAGAPDN